MACPIRRALRRYSGLLRTSSIKTDRRGAVNSLRGTLDTKAREVVFETIKEEFGHLDIVFANAGIGRTGSIAETSEELFDEVLRINLAGAFLTIKSALPLLRRGSSIILNGSIAEFHGFPPGAGSYAASKGGMHSTERS
jgi:NAD(P)-dependent dehydrogenase (short-subunit alcohol dehydrogenase family)